MRLQNLLAGAGVHSTGVRPRERPSGAAVLAVSGVMLSMDQAFWRVGDALIPHRVNGGRWGQEVGAL